MAHEKMKAELRDAKFTAAPVPLTLDGLLFDLDGTVVDSTKAITAHWYKLGNLLNVDPEMILATSHGRRSIDTLQLYDPNLATWEYVKQVEGEIPYQFGKDAVLVPGSKELLSTLEQAGAPWAVVTSGTQPLLRGWLDVMKLATPKNLVTAEDVERGKPDPACYKLGRSRLGLPEGSSMLVLEDAPSGIRAGKAAGFQVVAVATTHAISALADAGADWIVEDLRSVVFKGYEPSDGKVQIEVSHALVR